MKKRLAAALLVAIVAAVGIFSTTIAIIQSAEAFIDPTTGGVREPRAPMAASKMGTMSISFGGLTGQETGK